MLNVDENKIVNWREIVAIFSELDWGSLFAQKNV